MPVANEIITDGLVGYWNSNKGVSGNVWANLAPATKGKYNGTINGATITADGMYFDGSDNVDVPLPDEMRKVTAGTVEMTLKVPSVDIWGESREFISALDWAYLAYASSSAYPVLSGLFDARGGMNTRLLTITNPSGVDKTKSFQITITANPTTGVITGQYYDVETKMSGEVVSYNATVDRMAKTDIFCLGGKDPKYLFKGIIDNVRIYNRILTASEIAHNRTIGRNVGLPLIKSNVNYISSSKQKISDEPTMNQSIITVRFDNDVTEYVARLNGSSYSTGTLVHQGGSVKANTNAQVIIDWNELSTEGSNRINIYGKSADGVWTEYQN